MKVFRDSDYFYLLITSTMFQNKSTNEKYLYLKKVIYSKGRDFSIAKAIISSITFRNEKELFTKLVKVLYSHDMLTRRKRDELLHLIELKY